MSKYTVKFYAGNYKARQEAANADKCIAYVEHHFNSSASAQPDYACALIAHNASSTSRQWGQAYVDAIRNYFTVGSRSAGDVWQKNPRDRGNSNLRHTDMPTILAEPFFGSNLAQANIIRSKDGQRKLAQALVDSIKEIFPGGGLVAFSIGHKGKTKRPLDRGATLNGGGMEADYAELVLNLAAKMLQEDEVPDFNEYKVHDASELIAELYYYAREIDNAELSSIYEPPLGIDRAVRNAIDGWSLSDCCIDIERLSGKRTAFTDDEDIRNLLAGLLEKAWRNDRAILEHYDIRPGAPAEEIDHWIVDDGQAWRLEAMGEKVVRDLMGLSFWCEVVEGAGK